MTDLVRQEVAKTAKIWVVKVGTRVLTDADGRLDETRIARLAEDIAVVRRSGHKVVLVSSGAVGCGMARLGLVERPTNLAELQAVAAVGQSLLIETYNRTFQKFGISAAQILLTAEDLEHRARYLNARNTILTLLERYDAVPIINENDTVSVDELRTTFGDNDRLAAIVVNLIRAQLLVLLSDVDGLYDRDPRDPEAELIPLVRRLDDDIMSLAFDRDTGLSRGGMASKLNAARLATTAGENTIIAPGRTEGVLQKILNGDVVGTLFLAQGGLVTSRKRWFGLSVQPRGHIVVDAGARQAIEKGGKSLLPIGIIDVVGHFSKGDVVAVRDADGVEFARGLTNYSAEEIRRVKGLRTDQIANILPYCPYEEVIHRDNLLVTR
ncbi:MAG: glutamate 5-kinase [Planctomycetota bacterium]|nr:MAG: glutamate 5-kinase [Planctomycetota bacterium]